MSSGLRWSLRVLGGLLLLAILCALIVWSALRASLPRLDGTVSQSGATAGAGVVTLERDALGVVTITAANVDDAARALGFAHAQDRYFQMDLSRRLAAGELAELFGERALEQDRKARIFGFRALARQVLAAATTEERSALAAYTRGVNAGLASLGARPWEYWLLRTPPAQWRDEDSVLVVYAMWWQLQYNELARERTRLELTARLRELAARRPDGVGQSVDAVVRFFFARGTDWDAPNFATQIDAVAAGLPQPPTPPDPAELDLRSLPPLSVSSTTSNYKSPSLFPQPFDADAMPGSNNWAVDGAHSASGAALIANDMHLGTGVPPVWYRARIKISGQNMDLNGVTLPGTGALVAGSNGHIAWGFTNNYGDWSDLAAVSCDLTKNSYDTDEGTREFALTTETIQVKGDTPVHLEVRRSPLGIMYASTDDAHHCLLVRWLALDPQATNLRMLSFNAATTVQEALQLAPLVGIPHQNLVVGDQQGHIAWTVIGRVPQQDAGPSANEPLTWRDATSQPQIVDPEIGRLWTANARVVDGDAERVIGHDEAVTGAGYGLGARAKQIRDDLLALQRPATPADMLAIQLDDRAKFLERWRTLLMGILDEDALRNNSQRGELRRLVAQWDARASADAVGYRLVREFHRQTEQATFKMIEHALGLQSTPDAVPPQFDGALWRMVTEQPQHLLAADQSSWRAFLLAQVDATIKSLRETCSQLADCRWGRNNLLQIRHPLSITLGPLAKLLDMPQIPMPGDNNMPRVQGRGFGASERFAVSPGHESEGYMELPGGQAGNPLSPYYRAGLDAWIRGLPAPFLPGPTLHTLSLGIEQAHD